MDLKALFFSFSRTFSSVVTCGLFLKKYRTKYQFLDWYRVLPTEVDVIFYALVDGINVFFTNTL